MHKRAHARVNSCTHTHARERAVHAHMYTHAEMHAHTRVHVPSRCTHTHTHAQAHAHAAARCVPSQAHPIRQEPCRAGSKLLPGSSRGPRRLQRCRNVRCHPSGPGWIPQPRLLQEQGPRCQRLPCAQCFPRPRRQGINPTAGRITLHKPQPPPCSGISPPSRDVSVRLSVASILKGSRSHMEGAGAAGSRCNAPNGIEEGGAEIGFNPPERWAAI